MSEANEWNEHGPVNIPGRGWEWQISLYGARLIAAEHAFWTCAQLNPDDILRIMDSWEIENDRWTRRYVFKRSNKHGDICDGDVTIWFKPESAEIVEVDGR